MLAVCVTFRIHEGGMEKFLPRMRQQAHDSLELEPGCHRFDICGNAEGSGTVFLYELYSDQEAFALHNQSAHFKSFASDVAELVAEKDVSTFTLVDVGKPT